MHVYLPVMFKDGNRRKSLKCLCLRSVNFHALGKQSTVMNHEFLKIFVMISLHKTSSAQFSSTDSVKSSCFMCSAGFLQ